MKFRIACPNCEKLFAADEGSLGRMARCSQCGEQFELSPSVSQPIPLREESTSAAGERGGESPPVNPSQPNSQDRNNRQATSVSDRSIARFEVGELLGSGAFGKVYRAFDPQLQRDVALKIPQPGLLEQPKAVERFLREARAAAQLRHPNIVPVFDAGEQNGDYYIAAAFIEGQPLADVIEGQPLDADRVATIVRKLADALDYAHRQGILHRDIKPANIMLDENDVPHLMDFGLARFEGSEEKLTRDGTLMGTPAYMSPEQCDPKRSHELTPAADQYSLGCVMYELLTGHTPFSGPVQVQVLNHLKVEPKSPSAENPKIPRDLETICLKSLSKKPQKRYTSCADLAEDLHRWQQQLPIQARRIGPVERFTRWCRRNPLIAGLTAVMALVLLVGVAVSSYFAIVASRNAAAKDRLLGEQKQMSSKLGRALQDQNEATARAGKQTELAKEQTALAEEQRRRVKAERGRALWLNYGRQIARAQIEWKKSKNKETVFHF